MIGIRSMFWLVVTVIPWVVVVGAAHAQPARNSVERNRAAMCAKADADGDSYRPFVCDARCDWTPDIPPAVLTAIQSCVEAPSGTITAETLTTTPFDDGICNPPSCTGSSLDFCAFNDECPLGEECVSSFCIRPCQNNSECVGQDTEITRVTLQGVSSGDPAQPVVFDDEYELNGNVVDSFSPPSTINGTDALQCIAEIETASGVSCPTLP
jgi:hypothetical protein